jgi:MSHA biogenesis protein MshK
MNKAWMFSCAIVFAMPAAGTAQGLADPTRPPLASADAFGEDAPASRLQSILISSGRKLAVINGQTVPLGGRAGDATLVRIDIAEVTLKRGDQYETLRMYPGIDKKSALASRNKKNGEGDR